MSDPGPKIGIWAWSFVGFVVAISIVVGALGAVSEIVLPLTFAAVLAVVFKPLARVLERHGFKPSLAAGLIVLGLLAVTIGVMVATVRGIADQADEISASVDASNSQRPSRVRLGSIKPLSVRLGRQSRERPR